MPYKKRREKIYVCEDCGFSTGDVRLVTLKLKLYWKLELYSKNGNFIPRIGKLFQELENYSKNWKIIPKIGKLFQKFPKNS